MAEKRKTKTIGSLESTALGRTSKHGLTRKGISCQSLSNRLLHRFSYIMPGGYTLRPWIHKRRGVKLGRNVWISQFVYLDELHPEGITIGDNCTIGLRTSIFTHFYWGPRKAGRSYKEVVIQKDAYVGPHCLILPGVRIGEGAVIKGGSVVTREVPAYTFWGPPASGPLARVTVPLTPEHTYEAFACGLRPIRMAKKRKRGLSAED